MPRRVIIREICRPRLDDAGAAGDVVGWHCGERAGLRGNFAIFVTTGCTLATVRQRGSTSLAGATEHDQGIQALSLKIAVIR